MSESLKKTQYKDIARQLVEEKPGKLMNVIYGGGRDFLGASKAEKPPKFTFKGSAQKSCNRTDKINLVEKYLSQFDNKTMVKYVTNTGEMVDIDYENVDHVLGLFANNHLEYESLRDKDSDGQPSLTEMVKSAMRILNNKKNKNGWVLMVEGGKKNYNTYKIVVNKIRQCHVCFFRENRPSSSSKPCSISFGRDGGV